MQISLLKFINNIIAPAVLPIIILLLILFSIRDSLPLIKGKLYLFEVVLTGAGASLIATFLYYFTSNVFRNYMNQLFSKLKLTFIKIVQKRYIHLL